MRRIEINNGEAETLAGTPASPFGPPTGTSVIPFVRRADTTSVCLAAGGDPPSSPAPFIELGNAVASVVMNLRGGFPRILVLAPVLTPWEEEEEDWDEL